MAAFFGTALSGVGGYIAAGALSAIVAGYGTYRVTAAFKDETINQMKIADLQGVSDAWKLGWAARDHQAAITAKANTANEGDQARIAGNTQEIIRYVPKYITAKADAACVLPNGFVRLLDSALTATPPDKLPNSTGEPDDAPSGVTLSQATALLSQSLGDYAATRARLLNARDDWNAQATAATNAQSKPEDKPGWWARNIGSL